MIKMVEKYNKNTNFQHFLLLMISRGAVNYILV